MGATRKLRRAQPGARLARGRCPAPGCKARLVFHQKHPTLPDVVIVGCKKGHGFKRVSSAAEDPKAVVLADPSGQPEWGVLHTKAAQEVSTTRCVRCGETTGGPEDCYVGGLCLECVVETTKVEVGDVEE